MHSRHMHTWSEQDAWYVQDGITMPEGLWADGGKLQRDLATITQRIRLMGFNAVRLPFSMKDLFNLSPKYVCCATACSCPCGCVASRTTHRLRTSACAARDWHLCRNCQMCSGHASDAELRWCVTGRAQRNAKS